MQRKERLREIRAYDYDLPHGINRHEGSVYHQLMGIHQAHEFLAETEFDEFGMVIGPKVCPRRILPPAAAVRYHTSSISLTNGRAFLSFFPPSLLFPEPHRSLKEPTPHPYPYPDVDRVPCVMPCISRPAVATMVMC